MPVKDAWDDFWSDDDGLDAVRDTTVVAAEKTARLRAASETVTRFATVLAQVFPRGTVLDPKRTNAGRLDRPTSMIEVGNHYIGITASVTPDGADTQLEAFWRMNISFGTAGRPVSKEMGSQAIRSEQGFVAWVSRTHARIVTTACDAIKTALHPDNVLHGGSTEATHALRGGQVLRLVNVVASTITEKVVQPLPWREHTTNTGQTSWLVNLLSGGHSVGMIALRQTDDGTGWKFGMRVTLADHVQPPAEPIKFAKEMKDTWGQPAFLPEGPVPVATLEEAQKRAEAVYATYMASCLIEQAATRVR